MRTDNSVEQSRTAQSQACKTFVIYREDLKNSGVGLTWVDLCESVGVSPDSDAIDICVSLATPL